MKNLFRDYRMVNFATKIMRTKLFRAVYMDRPISTYLFPLHVLG